VAKPFKVTDKQKSYNWTFIGLLVSTAFFRFAYYAIGSAKVFDTIECYVFICTQFENNFFLYPNAEHFHIVNG